MARSAFFLRMSLAFLAAAACASPADANQGDDAHLVRADAQGVTFECATPQSASAASPRTVWIAVPPGATVQVTSSILAEESIEGLRLGSAVFGLDTSIAPEEPHGAPERGLTLDALARAASAPPEASGSPGARLLGITGLRGLRVAAVEVRPGVYESAGDRLRIATRLAVDCAFVPLVSAAAPAASPPRSTVFAGIEQAMLLNAQSADGFRGRAARATPRRLVAGPLSSALEVRVAGKGVHEITGSDIAAAGVPLGGRDPRWFRLFTRPGLPLLAEDSTGTAYERAEVALRVDDGNDGTLDPDDRILFYAVGPSGWFDDYGVASADTLDWLQNPYETHNVYLLQMDPEPGDAPLRWATRDAAPVRPGAAPVDHVRARMHFEDELFYVPDSNEPDRTWNPWAWSRIASFSGPVEVPLQTDGVVPARAARFQARVWGRRSPSYDPNPLQLDVSLNRQPVATRSWFGGPPQVIDTTGTWLVEGENLLRLRLAPPPGQGISHDGNLMACDLMFDRRLLAVGDTLEFTAPDLAGDLAYEVAPFSDAAGLTLLDVTDPLRPVELAGWAAADTTAGRVVRFHDDRPGARYFAASAAARRRPALASRYTRDLRTGAADYLVICSDAFSGEAQRLAEHRRTDAPPFPGATAQAVSVGDIFAAYSGGRMDPAAIRNFLFDAVHGGGWSPAPSFVCFLGDASYDHRDIFRLGGDLGRTQVPTFQRNFWAAGQYASDDWLVDLDVAADDVPGAGDVPDLVVGRLPAATAAEATRMVDKVLLYDRIQSNDSWPQSGDWRNRLLWLVDDASQGAQPDPLGSEFTRQAEELDRAHLPTWLERVKVNLFEYPLVGGRTKPGAEQETIDQLRRGALVWFFIGRGNPYLLADEHAFRLDDVAALGNGHLLPFFIAQTASVGLFDVPWSTGFLGEAMVKDPNGGSIATYAATGVTYSSANDDLATALTDALFAPDRLEAGRTIGEAAFVAGRRTGGSLNDRLYQLLGDPGMRLATAPRDVRLAFFDDETGEALPDSLPRGRVVRVEAEVHRTRDSSTVDLASDFNGVANFRVSDSPPLRSYPPDLFGQSASYVGNPRDAALAAARVVAGRGTARFVIPLAATPGPGARVQAWVEDPAGNASGARAYTLGAARADRADVTGPRIEIQLGGIWGPVHGPSESFAVFLLDPSGVRTLADSTRHRITISLDGAPPTDVTSSVHPVVGRHDLAVFVTSFGNLANGTHTVRVEASDNLALADDDVDHRTSTEVTFRVAAVVASLEPRAIAFPNPFVRAAGTTVVFGGLRGGSNDEVIVVIFDIRGRRLRALHGRGGSSSIEVRWDGRDDAGHALPPGVYPWRAVLSLYGATTQEHRGRLVLLD